MESPELEIEYKGHSYKLPVSLHPYGYSYRIHVLHQEKELIFEPDEEQNFRAIQLPDQEWNEYPDQAFLSLVADTLARALH